MGTHYCVGPIIIVFLLIKLLQIHSKVYSQTKSSNSVGKWGLSSPFSSLPLGPRVYGIIWVLEIVQPSMAQASVLCRSGLCRSPHGGLHSRSLSAGTHQVGNTITSIFLSPTLEWSCRKPWAQLIISSSLSAAAAVSAFLSYFKATCTTPMNTARSKGNSSSSNCKKQSKCLGMNSNWTLDGFLVVE